MFAHENWKAEHSLELDAFSVLILRKRMVVRCILIEAQQQFSAGNAVWLLALFALLLKTRVRPHCSHAPPRKLTWLSRFTI